MSPIKGDGPRRNGYLIGEDGLTYPERNEKTRAAKRKAERHAKDPALAARRPLGQRIAESGSRSRQGERALLAERAKKFDPDATTDDLIEDLRRLQEAEPGRFITRNWYREHGKYSDMTWGARFGTFHEFRRQAGLEHHRGGQRMERNIATHAARDRYRGFYEIEILPWIGKYERTHAAEGLKRVIVGSDFHDKKSDPFVLAVFIEACRRVQPDIIALNGDVFDLYDFSRFDKDPRLINLRSCFEFVRDEIFAPLREACPGAQIDLIIGNHESRLLRHMADRTPYLVPLLDFMGITLSKLFGLDQFQINLVSKLDLSAYQPKESREEIAKNYKIYFGCLLVGHHPGDYGICSVAGHTHKPVFIVKVNELSGAYFQHTLGSISEIDHSYVEGLNRYSQSFGIYHIDPVLKEIVPEHIVFTHHLAIVGGVVYRRAS